MSSKLDYLSKYTSSSIATNDDDQKKRRKKKKNKKHKKDGTKSTTILCVDEDEETYRRLPFGGEGGKGIIGICDDGDGDDDDFNNDLMNSNIDGNDDGPVVVEEVSAAIFSDGKTTTRGAWKKAADVVINERSNSSNSNVNVNSSTNANTAGKRRHDSSCSDNEEEKDKRRNNGSRRYDSDSDDEDNENKTEGGNRYRRYDSDLNSDESGIERRRRRYDSDDDDDDDDDDNRQTTRQRHDSDSDNENDESNRQPTRKRRYDSDHSYDDDDGDGGKKRMSSGHKAGLQHYKDFNKSEKKIQERKRKDAKKMVDKYGMGETVYRDKDGKKDVNIDMDGKSKEEIQLDAQRCLNQGKVQKTAQVAMAKEMAILQNSTFARRQDDERLEELRKNEIRKDDPMARYARNQNNNSNRKNSQNHQQQQQQIKSMYKGPPPKANRFGIRPGYRWDGVDRGNGFEDKVLAKKFSTNRKKEEAYRWSSADM